MARHTFWPMFKKELYEQYRTYRILIAGVVLLLMGLSSPIVTKLTPDLLQSLGNGIKIEIPPQTASDALNAYLKNMLQLPPLMLILLAMGCVADERSRGTAVTILTKPVSRSVFVLTKFLAYTLTIFAGITLAAVGDYLYTTQLFTALPLGGFLLLNLAMLIVFMLILAITVLTSVLFRNSVAAGGLAFVGFIVLNILPTFNADIARALPSQLFSGSNVSQVMEGSTSPQDVLWSLGWGVLIILLLLTLCCFVFRRQEV